MTFSPLSPQALVMASADAIYNEAHFFFGNVPHPNIRLCVQPQTTTVRILSLGFKESERFLDFCAGEKDPVFLDLEDPGLCREIELGAPYCLQYEQDSLHAAGGSAGRSFTLSGARIQASTGRDRSALEEAAAAGMVSAYLERYPAARALLEQGEPEPALAYDPQLGYGIRFCRHEAAVDLFRRLLANVVRQGSFQPGPGCEHFAMGEFEGFILPALEALMRNGYPVEAQEEPSIGPGAWLGLLAMELYALLRTAGFWSKRGLPAYNELHCSPLALLYRYYGEANWE